MLGMYNLLPLLSGWEYKDYEVEVTAVRRGADPIEARRVLAKGWLNYIELITDDAYGSLIVEYQGAGLETHRATFYPEFYQAFGAVTQDPSGWCMLYQRPNPLSTMGIYDVIAWSGGAQGAPLPFVPTVAIKLYLPKDSTQDFAYINGYATIIAITDDKKFTESMREVLGVKETNKLLHELIKTVRRALK